jgi:RNA recognition motif-containing protein
LTKDKKRIDSQEVEVAPVWKATLYVTNFPEKYDAADMQQLFEPVSDELSHPAGHPTDQTYVAPSILLPVRSNF